MPSLSQNGDAVAIYADNGAEICRAEYTNALAGVSVEFDASCLLSGNSTNGVNGAFISSGGDVGSPGNLAPCRCLWMNSIFREFLFIPTRQKTDSTLL